MSRVRDALDRGDVMAAATIEARAAEADGFPVTAELLRRLASERDALESELVVARARIATLEAIADAALAVATLPPSVVASGAHEKLRAALAAGVDHAGTGDETRPPCDECGLPYSAWGRPSDHRHRHAGTGEA